MITVFDSISIYCFDVTTINFFCAFLGLTKDATNMNVSAVPVRSCSYSVRDSYSNATFPPFISNFYSM